MDISNIKQAYFIGIGGIGMSALARYFRNKGCLVFGYDKTKTALTNELVKEGIHIIYEDDPNQIPEVFNIANDHSLVVITPAIPDDLKIKTALAQMGHVLYKRAWILGQISRHHFTVAIAGTHGKTTISCLIAHMLTSSGISCSAFLGGIATNYKSNFISSDSNILVVEADEYDRSFLSLHPDIAIVTATDADHLDIYGEKNLLVDSFKLFVGQTVTNGLRIIKKGLDLPSDINYDFEGPADAYSTEKRIVDGEYYFNYHQSHIDIPDIHLGIPGDHNIENAVAAITAVLKLGVSPNLIKQALSSFRGVKRRFEYIVKNEHHIYIDDYAHHPEELKALFGAVKQLYPHKRLTVIFQPHLFTRTRDFGVDFARILALADELILLPIYPARENAIEGISSDWLLEQVEGTDKKVLDFQAVLKHIEQKQPELLLTVGAGDIDKLVNPLKEVLNND